jgi:sensor histidine kinase YesM
MLYIEGDRVPINQELSYIIKYIELQKLRFDHPIKTELCIDHASDKISVPPLLFIPFVENAFKHGDFSSSEEGINLDCSITKDRIRFSVKNKIRSGSKDDDSGIGLQNVQKRLNLIYPNKHSLNIQQADSFFQIQLAIPNE